MGAVSSLQQQQQQNTTVTRLDTITNNDLRKSRNFASTIKKRFSSKKSRRFLKQLDYNKILRDFLFSWSTDNLIQLINDYETNSILKEFYLQSELSRPLITSVSQDLRRLYETSETADVYLEFKGQKFPVHKSVVCARCPLFRELLGKIYTLNTIVPIEIDIAEITTDLFTHLLSFLYSGELNKSFDDEDYKNLFKSLAKHVPNDLEFDLKYLLDTGLYSDVKLIFKNSLLSTSNSNLKLSNSSSSSNCTNSTFNNLNFLNSTKNLTYNSTASQSPTKRQQLNDKQQSIDEHFKCAACSSQTEYSCHAVVLASRSRFFRNLILKYQAKNLNQTECINASKQNIRIVLDECHIQKRYINIILNVIYCDGTNILNLLPNCVCKCTPSSSFYNLDNTQQDSFNSNAFTSTITNLTTSTIFQTISNSITSSDSAIRSDHFINELIDLFVIGKFLELDSLIAICENLLVDAINLDTVQKLLEWSERNGSEFLRRQCVCFLREEFTTIATSQLLVQLNENQLIELIKSDFLQASEYEVMCSIIRWIEFKLDQQKNETKGLRDPFKDAFKDTNKDLKLKDEIKEFCLNSSLNSNHSTVSSSNNLSFNYNLIANSNQQNLKKMKRLNEEDEDLDRLKELISPFLKYLRIAHILPLENEVLKNALKNELITTLPPYMLNDDQTLSYERGIMAWINLENRANFVKPRLFQPFYEEARSLLEERLTRCEEINFNNKISIKKSFNMPDNLYMVNDSLSTSLNNKLILNDNTLNDGLNNSTISSTATRENENPFSLVDLDLNADRTMIKNLKEKFLINKLQIQLDYLDKETKNVIRQKSTEIYLRILPTIRQLNLEEKYEILIYIQLKVLREHNLSDEMLFIFEQEGGGQDSIETKENYQLNLNLRRRSLKSRKFSVNSIDFENYLNYDSIDSTELNNQKDTQVENNESNSQDASDQDKNQANYQPKSDNQDANQINNLIKYDDNTVDKSEISLDVFI